MQLEMKHSFDKNFAKFVKTDADKRSFTVAIRLLMDDQPLPDSYDDHQLQHQRKGIRDFHLKSDLVVVYFRIIGQTIQLIDVGPHNKLFKKYKKS